MSCDESTPQPHLKFISSNLNALQFEMNSKNFTCAQAFVAGCARSAVSRTCTCTLGLSHQTRGSYQLALPLLRCLTPVETTEHLYAVMDFGSSSAGAGAASGACVVIVAIALMVNLLFMFSFVNNISPFSFILCTASLLMHGGCARQRATP